MPQIVPWIQVLITLAGLLLAAIPQLTSKARLRARITFWGTQAAATDFEYDKKIAESLRRDAVAQLLALETYPAWRFLFPLYALLSGLIIAHALGWEIGDGYPEPFDFWQSGESDAIPPFVALLGFMFIAAGLLGLGHVLVWRRRVSKQYLQAETISREVIVTLNADGSPHSVQAPHGALPVSVGQGLGIGVFSLGIYGLVAVGTFLIVVGGLEDLSPNPDSAGLLILTLLGCLLATFAGAGSVLGLLTLEKDTWTHPRPMSQEAIKKATTTGEESIKLGKETWWAKLKATFERVTRNAE